MEAKRKSIVKVCSCQADFEDLENLLNGGYKVKGQPINWVSEETETPKDEIVYVLELEEEPEISSIRSVDINEADQLIKEGYAVKETFAKTVTLIKTEDKKVES